MHDEDRLEKRGSLGLPIASMALGLIAVIALTDSTLDTETLVGVIGSSSASLGIGILCVVNQRLGRWMAITGIVLGALSSVMAVVRLCNII